MYFEKERTQAWRTIQYNTAGLLYTLRLQWTLSILSNLDLQQALRLSKFTQILAKHYVYLRMLLYVSILIRTVWQSACLHMIATCSSPQVPVYPEL